MESNVGRSNGKTRGPSKSPSTKIKRQLYWGVIHDRGAFHAAGVKIIKNPAGDQSDGARPILKAAKKKERVGWGYARHVPPVA
jgi:hypothetical protein